MSLVRNPVLPGCYPDPSVCRVGQWYYLVCSTFEYLPGLPVMRSRDLVTWETVGHVVDREGMLDLGGIRSSGGLYAPTIRHDGERFWVVCTLVDQNDDQRGGNFVCLADDAAGPWSDPIWLDERGIDPSLFFDDDGRVWMHGTRLVDPDRAEWHDQTEVWIRELDRTSMKLTGPEHLVWNGALTNAVWAEGPHLYKVDGTYYLLAAEAGTEFHHAVSVARAERVTGPYVGNAGNPVLTHRHLGRRHPVVGVGHADLVETPDGDWFAVLLAMRTYGGYHYPLGRETFLVPVVWEDGWPVFAPGVGMVPREVEVPGSSAAPSGWNPGGRPGVVAPSDRRWTALRALPATVAAPDGDGWHLPVRADGLGEPGVPAFVGLRQQHQDVDVTLELDVAALQVGERAGLVLRQSEQDHVTLDVTPEGGRLVVRARRRAGADGEGVPGRADPRADALPGSGEPMGHASVAADAGRIVLGMRARGTDVDLFHRSPTPDGPGREHHVATADARWLDTVTTGGFLGLWIGAFATSDGRPAAGSVRVRLAYHPAGGSIPRHQTTTTSLSTHDAAAGSLESELVSTEGDRP
ncbi:glycoside hydrolase family 43 protein [Isoptericola sp. b408]|uniref:glycoside hydrolase family 43 protein n=1 Tax=Isoptericola sp. b408 TaxID=3064653 RepID=UPI0027133A01|nr:glycoside hydrolase family 43 protein [Isoptericola sp. b408]MDO8152071.1 family 43 glycosylhydrolase [Isoptericola sp. b408]